MSDGFIICSAKKACELMQHMNENDIVFLRVVNRKTYVHGENKSIKKKNGEDLIKQAENILYQDNDYFGTLTLEGVLRDKNIIHNILFPQLEWYVVFVKKRTRTKYKQMFE